MFIPRSAAKITAIVFTVTIILFSSLHSKAQMRQVYVDNTADNEIYKISFYSPSQGFVGFRDWIGYTADSGRTFTKKYITNGNVNFNGYSVNLTLGFGINGVKAFNQNTMIAYGDYGLVPSILYSTDGGNSFTLIYHSQYDQLVLSTGITDMIFPTNGLIGYAVDADRVLKTTDQGLTWNPVRLDPGSFFDHLEAPDDNDVFAFSSAYSTNKLIKTNTGGTSWQTMVLPVLPDGKMNTTYFLAASTGWLDMYDTNNNAYVFKTIDGGTNWLLVNNLSATPFSCYKMKFLDNNIGYALAGQNTVFKTFNGGASWEPLPRDNNYLYLGYTHNDMQVISGTQLWAGGGHGFLEINTNGTGNPLPKAYFNIDTIGFSASNTVNLVNFSRTGYTYKWYLNNVLLSNSYNSNYSHDIYHPIDTIKLVVSSGAFSDSTVKYQNCGPTPSPHILSFSPTSAGVGGTVTISGTYLLHTTAVRFGTVPANSFNVISGSSVQAVVGNGESGKIFITTTNGTDSIAGFTFLYPPPVLSSFSPAAATAGTTVSLFGNFFNGTTSVLFGGTPAASFTIVSQTQVDAVVGSGASGIVQVITTSGTSSLTGFTFQPGITVTSFSPASGPIGTVVSITGTHFSTNPTDNIVFFGAVRATVLAAGNTTLIVKVPAGASYLPISVTVNNQQASAAVPFLVTFPGGGSLNSNSFYNAGTYSIPGTSQDINNASLGDIDGDGKIDVVTGNTNNVGSVSVFPNTSTVSNISFGTRLDLFPGTHPIANLLRDLDGDGKPELIFNYGVINVAKNISTPGNIAFDNPFYAGGQANGNYGLDINDIDGDGRPDIAAASYDLSMITVTRNTSTGGVLSFEQRVEYPESPNPYGVVLADLDGDGKPEMITNHLSGGNILVYQNISVKGKIIFSAPITFPGTPGSYGIAAGDMDGDGKIDLVFAADNIVVYKNTSTGIGNFSLGLPVTCTNTGAYSVQIGDLDGDGKPDLLSANQSNQTVSIFRNTSNAVSISFEPKLTFNTIPNSFPRSAPMGDFDADGKLDFICANYNQRNFVAFRNRVNELPRLFAGRDTLLCSGSSATIGATSIPGYTYSWTSLPAGFTSSVSAPVITPNTTTSYYVSATSNTGINIKDTVIITVAQSMPPNTWMGSVDNNWGVAQNWSTGTVPNECTDVIINSGTVLISSNVSIGSLTLSPTATLTVSTGATLTILH